MKKHKSCDEILISNHIEVKKIKSEAKIFYKNQKNRKFSLMQCQEIIVRNYGFNNYYDFIKSIKNNNKEISNNSSYIITKNLENNNNFLIGYDLKLRHYKWHDDALMNKHQFIIGENVFKKYDTYLASQAIEKGNGVFFLNGVNDNNTLNRLTEKAVFNKREKDLIVLDDCSGQKLLNNFNMNSLILTDFFYNILSINNKIKYKKVINFLNVLIKALVYERDENGLILSLDVFKKYLSFNKFLKLYENSINKPYYNDIKNYLLMLTDDKINNINKEITVKKYNDTVFDIKQGIDKIIKLNIFSDDKNAIPIDNLLLNNKNIIIVNTKNSDIQKIFITLLKTSSMTQFDYNENKPFYNIFLRQVYGVKGFAVLPAQLRILNCSLTLSYSSIKKAKNILGENEFLSIFYSCNLKIFDFKAKSINKLLEVEDNDYLHVENEGEVKNILIFKDKKISNISYDL